MDTLKKFRASSYAVSIIYIIVGLIITIILISVEAIIIYSVVKRSDSKKEATMLVVLNLICFSLGFILSKISLPL